RVGVGVHAAGNGARVFYDGHCRPFLRLRDGTHPLAVGPGNPGLLPRPGRSDRQRRQVPENLGPCRQIVSQDSPSGVSRTGGQAGTQAPTLRPFHRETTEAGPEALSTVSLPNIFSLVDNGCDSAARPDAPIMDGLIAA